MGIELLTERHREQIAGVLSCFDRMIIQGTLPGLCFADGMTRYLNVKGIRIGGGEKVGHFGGPAGARVLVTKWIKRTRFRRAALLR